MATHSPAGKNLNNQVDTDKQTQTDERERTHTDRHTPPTGDTRTRIREKGS